MQRQTPDRPADPETLLNGVGAAFARLRRRTSQVQVEPPISRKDLTLNLVINVVDEADAEMTVGAVADTLGVDPSVASRMVSDAIAAGYLVRLVSQQDGRRVVLNLTAHGVSMRDQFRDQQRQAFEHITRDWTDTDRLELARLLIKYSESTA